MSPRPERGSGRERGRGASATREASAALFDPQKPKAELVDDLAEKEADRFGRRLSRSQVRKFFGEVKDLSRRLKQGQDYRTQIEPAFKMLRSKAQYAKHKTGGEGTTDEFVDFIDNGVRNHFEAVVGFWFGKYA